MNDKHITYILDELSPEGLSEIQNAEVQAHVTHCESCLRSFEAWRVSSVLLKARVAETFEPSPFFQTKMMAALREKQAKSVAAFWNWWQASTPVLSAMVVVIVALVVLTLFAPNAPINAQDQAAAFGNFSAETIILNEDLNAEITAGQTLQIIYEPQEVR